MFLPHCISASNAASGSSNSASSEAASSGVHLCVCVCVWNPCASFFPVLPFLSHSEFACAYATTHSLMRYLRIWTGGDVGRAVQTHHSFLCERRANAHLLSSQSFNTNMGTQRFSYAIRRFVHFRSKMFFSLCQANRKA